ncbi:MAG TPA: hypothetical protein VMU40_13310 [Steroidobacteraceae bacterium]|nr:hypothetical protein [Steroidobacteraceae bacterium]
MSTNISNSHLHNGAGALAVGIENFPNVTRALRAFLERPAVKCGLEIPQRD